MLTGKRLAKVKRLYRGRVRKGVALLDSKRSARGWRKKIDANRLRMESPIACLLGQSFGDFFVGMQMLGLGASLDEDFNFGGTAAGWELGFNLPPREQDSPLKYQRWSILAEAWRNRLARDARKR